MLKCLYKLRYILALCAIPYIALVVLFTARVDVVLTAPGGLNVVEKQITFPAIDVESEGSFHTVYVMVLRRPTLFQWFVSHADNGIHSRVITPWERDEDPRDHWRSEQASRSSAWNAAIILAATASGHMTEDDWEIQLLVTRIFEYVKPDGVSLLDRVVEVNGRSDIRSAIHDALTVEACGTLHSFKAVTIDDQDVEYDILSQEIDGVCRFGIAVSDYYHILDTFDVEYEIKQGFISGPSGGFMQFLHIYNSLTSTDISHGLKIAGTGGITPAGLVTMMGGIPQKVIAAHQAGAEIMFVPAGNLAEAEETLNTLKTTMVLVGVTHFSDAIAVLEGWEE